MSDRNRTTTADRTATPDRPSWRPHSPPGRAPASGRHRKPARVNSVTVVRAGVVTGVLGTVAAVSPIAANALEDDREQDTVTMELDLSAFSGETLDSDALEETSDRYARHAATQKAAAKKAAAQKAAAQKAAKAEAAKEKAAKAKAAKAAKAKAAKEKAAARAKAVTAQPAVQAPSDAAAQVVAFAKAQLGQAYVMGGTSTAGWDCSGLVQAAYKKAGIDLPRVSQSQSTVGREVSLSALKPGDILYWGGKGSATHVALYIGGGKFIGAQNPSVGVVERTLSYSPPSGAVRLL